MTTSSKQDADARCVILCHGYASFKNGFHLPALAAALADAGYNSLRFDFTGNGDSEGHFKFANYIGEVGDIQAAKSFLEQQEGQRVIGLLGHSKGGDDVILYAKLHGDIPLVINVAGRFDLKEGIEQRFGADIFNRVLHEQVVLPAQRDDGHSWTWQLTPEDLEERLSLDMAAAAAAVKHVKVLTIHGTADKVIPVEDGRKFAATLQGNRIVEVEGADHNFTGSSTHLQQLIAAVLNFLKEEEEFSLPSPRPDDSSLASP